MKAPIVKAPPISSLLGKKRRKRQDNDDFFDFDDFIDENDDFFGEMDEREDSAEVDAGEYFSAEFYPLPYCNVVQEMKEACIEMSILELWANDGNYDEVTDRAIAELTFEDVVNKINTQNVSGVFLIPRNFTNLLSNVKRDSTGRIIGAEATVMRWLGKMNGTEAKLHPVKGRGEPIAQQTLDFEGEMIKVMLNNSDFPTGLEGYPNVKRSFGDIAGSTILGDVGVMAIGYMIVFVYVTLMLGRFNCIEQRFFTINPFAKNVNA